MKISFKAIGASIALIAVVVFSAVPAHAAKLYFGTQEYLQHIQDVEVKGPKGEALYLGYKYSFHSFILPYRMTDDGYVLGVRGEQTYFRLDESNIKSMQARGHSFKACELALEQIASKRFPLEKITTHKFGLKDVDLAIRSVGNKPGGVPDVIHASLMPWE